MAGTTNRRGTKSSECVSHSSRSFTKGPSRDGRHHRLGDFIAQYVPDIDRDEADAYVLNCVTCRVQRLASKCNLDGAVQDDLSQDFLLAVIQAIPRYDARRSRWKTFVNRALNRQYKHILRDLMSVENGGVDTVGFDELEEDAEEAFLDPATASGDPHVATDLRHDVAVAISTLPEPRLRRIARLLMVHSPSKISRILKTSPTAVARAMRQIRMHFEAVGLSRI